MHNLDDKSMTGIRTSNVWRWLVRLISPHPLTYEEEQKRILFAFLVVLTGGILSLFAVKHIFTANYSEGFVDTAVAIVVLGSLLGLRRSSDGKYFYRGVVALWGALFVYFGTLGEGTESRALWIFSYPPFVFFFAGIRLGTLLSAWLLLAWCGIFFLPEGITNAADYDMDFIVRFLASYTVISIMSWFLEYVRSKYAYAISRARARLEQDNVLLRKAEEQSRYLALNDALTQLPNRRSIMEELVRQKGIMQRTGATLSMIMLDIDHFKKINDTYGHAAGDAVLQEVGRRIERELRADDFAGRYGGEEFVVILPSTSLEKAKRVAERIGYALRTEPFKFEGDTTIITGSMGVAAANVPLDEQSLLRNADSALYEAKRAGRDCVVSFAVADHRLTVDTQSA